MFGLGSAPELLNTRDVEVCLNDLLHDTEEGHEAWIITPFATMKSLGSQRRAIAEAARRGARISFVIRNEPDQVNAAKADLEEAIGHGLNLYAFTRLHAKVYWFSEHGCILTSANLVDGSFEKSTEIGMFIPEGNKLHAEVREWIHQEIEPGLSEIKDAFMKRESFAKREAFVPRKSQASTGYCIRCKADIKHRMEQPYCPDCYKSWERFSNPEYKEKFCHKCGKEAPSTMMKPLCYSCFKAIS